MANNGSESLPPAMDSIALHNDRAEIDALIGRLEEKLGTLAFSNASVFAIRLALEEGIANAFRHGHSGLDPATPVQVEFGADAERVWIDIEDQGPGFEPESIPDPTLDENLDQPTGRGLMLMKAYMTEVVHNDRGNRVRMIYQAPAS